MVLTSTDVPPPSSRLEEKPPVRCGLVKEGECFYPE